MSSTTLQRHSIINGRDLIGPATMTVVNPATEQKITTVSTLDGAGAEAAVAAARDAFTTWSVTELAARQELLARWLQLLLEHQDELARLVSSEAGKPVAEARLVDLFPALETLKYYARHLDRLLAFRPVAPEQILFRHWQAGYRFDPLGVLAVITPWNYPIGIPMAEIVPAVAAGNTVVFKPASATVLTGLALGDLARQAGFPDGVINTVALPGAVTDHLLDHPDVVKVLFTGSVEVGRHVARRCAERLIPAQLELGGKDAAVVAADAGLERTVNGLVWGAFMNTGQTCASIERVYVERPIAERLIPRLVARTRQLRVGDPAQPETDVGSLTTRGQRALVAQQVAAAIAAGAQALTGGAVADGPGYFYPPTVLIGVTDKMEIMQEETFGPVMPIQVVDSLDEAIRRANATRFGLTASGWTSSPATAAELQRRLEAGVVTINEHAVAFAEVTGCWGGLRESGIGRAHGPFGLHELVNIKYVVHDPGDDAAMPWYYPYDQDLDRFLDGAMPLLYAHGLDRWRSLETMAGSDRFRQRVRKGTLLRNLSQLW